MADTFTNIYLHLIFAVKYRNSLLSPNWRNELFRYIAGVIHQYGHVPIIVGGWENHVHILLSAKKSINIPDLVKIIKVSSNAWIQPKSKFKFYWQSGYGCFSVSFSHVNVLIDYIANQEFHHSHTSMIDEFRKLFELNGVKCDDEYFFKDPV